MKRNLFIGLSLVLVWLAVLSIPAQQSGGGPSSSSAAGTVTTNTIGTNDLGVVTAGYAAAIPSVALLDFSLGSVFKLDVTKPTTILTTNFNATTNRFRNGVVYLRQNASGTWPVGTVGTNLIVLGGTTNLVMDTNATHVTIGTIISGVFTNAQGYIGVSTNAFP
jgi:hypothetical protein